MKDHPRPPERPHRNCYWVELGRLLAGEYPGASEPPAARAKLRGYLEAGITFFLDLTDPRDGLMPYAELLQAEAAVLGRTVEHRRMTIRDMDVPPQVYMREILSTLETALAEGHNVYVHCWGGIGRTGTVVGCYLAQNGLTGDQALKQIAHWWRGVAKSWLYPRSPQTEAQVAYVRKWKRELED